MIARLGLVLSAVFRRIVPDPLVLLVLLLIVAVLWALTAGTFPSLAGAPSLSAKCVALLDGWRGSEGFWKFLAFGMQMSLMLVTGHALAAAPAVRGSIHFLALRPRGGHAGAWAAAMVGFVACSAALLNWGLGLIVGALLAREVGRSLRSRGCAAHYPLLCAAGYTGLLIWHGGLSGSAPLSMTTVAQAAKVLPKEFVDLAGDSIIVPLSQTTFSAMNLFITGGLLVLIPACLWLLAPRGPHCEPPAQGADAPAAEETRGSEEGRIPAWLDRSRLLGWALLLPIAGACARSVAVGGFQAIGLNEVILLMFSLGLALHGSLKSYAAAAEAGASDCAGVIVQFPIYGGILAVLAVSGLGAQLATSLAGASGPRVLPLNTFFAASVLNMFVTSGGGLWGMMGPIALQAGEAAGVAPGKMVMAVAYGDQLTNMLQPFWALPLLAITGVKARDIVGYTAIVMLVAGVWIGVGLLVF